MKKIIIVGAGVAGRLLKSDIESGDDKNELSVIGFIDDAVGTGVIGRFADIPKILDTSDIDELVIALPSERGKVIRKVLLHKSEYPNVHIKILPRATDVVVGGEVSYSMVRSLDLTDIVGERLDRRMHEEIAGEIKDKVVMITGGGGSIGSEIVKQIFLAAPKKVIIIDSCELNLFDISNSIERLQHNSPQSTTEFVLGNVLNTALMDRLFAHNNIDYIFHAAAYKHVPIVEVNAYEGLANNFYATYQLAELAQKYKVPKFILISTDKAVKPLNIMGKSKRLAELAVQYFDGLVLDSGIFTSVRFGNVFNSSGSAVQLFQNQLNTDNSLVITDSRMTRFFMTIPEAVNLVLQTAIIAEKGKTYMLEMGDPVGIEELAKCIAVLKGKRLSDITVKYSGLRPGEKLEEELFDKSNEERKSTKNHRIFAITNKSNQQSSVEFGVLKEKLINSLRKEYVQNHSEKGVLELVSYLSDLS